MTSLAQLLSARGALLADGATGTTLFDRGLTAGDAPEFWNVDRPEEIRALHRSFVEAGSDIILTNTFGANRFRMKLHAAEDRVFELNRRAAELAREVADGAGRPVLVAGSVGPTGELFEPLGALKEEAAIEAFTVQAEGLKAGGADLCWIETMSAADEIRAAAKGAIAAGLPYTATASFDTAGRTMMGLDPLRLGDVFEGLSEKPLAFGANCGVGASDLLMSLLAIHEGAPGAVLIAKANCGVPVVHGDHVHYSGTPETMAAYVRLALDSGARIVGGCCGTTAVHLKAMRAALDAYRPGEAPDQARIEAETGPLVAPPPSAATIEARRRRSRRA